MSLKKLSRRKKIHKRIRKKIEGTASCPRFTVFRSNTNIYAQLVDDIAGHTLISASSLEDEVKSQKGTKSEQAKTLGQIIAKKALDAGISKVVFDRSGYLYHGRVKALAEGAREGGLKF